VELIRREKLVSHVHTAYLLEGEVLTKGGNIVSPKEPESVEWLVWHNGKLYPVPKEIVNLEKMAEAMGGYR
jgi:hypothetical protein